MQVAADPRWGSSFAGFSTPFIHPDPETLRELADGCGFQVTSMAVIDREWDFGGVEQFTAWCTVGSTAWTERLPESDRAAFVDDMVAAYQPVAGRAGLLRFMQVRAELHL